MGRVRKRKCLVTYYEYNLLFASIISCSSCKHASAITRRESGVSSDGSRLLGKCRELKSPLLVTDFGRLVRSPMKELETEATELRRVRDVPGCSEKLFEMWDKRTSSSF